MDSAVLANESMPEQQYPPIDIGWIKVLRDGIDSAQTEILCSPYSVNRSATVPGCVISRGGSCQIPLSQLPPISAGTGAGNDLLTAAEHGLLELIEHDAVAHWWFGRRRATRMNPLAHPKVRDYLSRIRVELADQRNTFLFELPATHDG